MRFIAPIAALLLAGIAWVACWQEVQLVRLKRQLPSPASAAQPTTPAPASAPAPAADAPVRLPTFSTVPVAAPVSSLDQLRTLVAERAHAIADARDAASDFGIAAGSPEMERAILLATQDIDRSILKLAGPDVAAQLTAPVPQASVPADVQVATPSMPAVVMIGGPVPSAAAPVPPATNAYVNAAAPIPIEVDSPQPAEPSQPAYASQPYIYGGLGATYGRPAPLPKETATQKLQYFAAGAGIPLTPSPLGMVVATSPLLLMKQRTASGATGR